MGFSIGKISLGSPAHKRYNHNLSFDNNTTFDFGSVQPLMCQYMMPNSDIKVSYKQLVRLAPLVAPSFARVHLQNEVSFVSVAEVVPYFEAMLARMPYSVGSKTYKPERLPVTTNAFLAYWLLVGCSCPFSYWQPAKTPNTDDLYNSMKLDGDGAVAVTAKIKKLFFGNSTAVLPGLQVTSQLHTTNVSDINQSYVSFESADYILKFDDGFAVTFRLNQKARRLRKLFLGLGYSLNMTDNTPVSFAPILAFYKAWFDLYAVRREKSWTSTSTFALIKYIEDNYFTDFTYTGFVGASGVNILQPFKLFFDELLECWYVYKDDFVSVHRSSPQLVNRGVSYIDAQLKQSIVNNNNTNADYRDPTISASGNFALSLTNVGLQTLQRLSRFVNKDSVIAQRMSDWLRIHYGADVANSIFKDVNHVSSSRLDLQINDVMSTSDTAQGEGDAKTGEVLGAYAGKGIGFQNSGFKFHANTAGFIFVMSAIVPESGYFQGTDTSLYGINNDTLPNPDFDALGMELTPKGAIASDNGIFLANGDTLTDKAFGYIPRYSGFKVKKNIVNGDMSRRGTIDTFSAYYLDRILTSTVVTSEDKKGSQLHVSFSATSLPVASDKWRYCSRYPWLGNYNRLFYNSGKFYKGGSNTQLYDAEELVDDNFMCQSIFDVRVTNSLKPISDSYDTYEETTDKGTVDVMPE